jgi:hypothetical protein
MGRGRAAVLAGALAAVRIIGLVVVLGTPATHRSGHVLVADVGRLQEVAASDSLTPRHVEYPPLAVAAARATVRHQPFHTAVTRLAVVMLTLDLAAAVALAIGFSFEVAAAYLLLGLPLLPFVYFRIDLLSVALAAIGMALVARRRPVAGGVVVAAGAFVKVWPAVLVPVLFARGERRAALAAAATGAAGTLAWAAAAGVAGPVDVLTFRHARGLHIESVAGALWRVIGRQRIRFEAGAFRTPPVPGAVRLGLLAALIVAVGAATVWAARRRRPGRPELTAVAATVATAALFSPQYVAWLLPFAAIARDDTVERFTLLVAALSTSVVVQFGPLRDGAGVAQATVLLRNASLLALIWVARPRE